MKKVIPWDSYYLWMELKEKRITVKEYILFATKDYIDFDATKLSVSGINNLFDPFDAYYPEPSGE